MSALGDVIVDALQELLEVLFSPIESLIETHAGELVRLVVGTPYPNAVFGRPSNGPWPAIYDYYWESVLPLSLTLWGVSVGIVIFLHATGHLFSSYHRSALTRRAFSGLLGILSWWWLAALSLRFIDALTDVIVPPLNDISLFETLSFAAMGVLGAVIALSADLVLFALIAVIYLARQVALYMFVLLMPLLIVFWIPSVGPFTLVSGLMRRLAGFFVPFLFMTVPVAVLFRLGALLGESVDPSMGGFGAWLLALVIPVVAVLSPFVLFWQAGSIALFTGSVARNVSTTQARNRAGTIGETAQSGVQGGQNFARGVRDEPAVRPNGQYVLDSGSSRAHRAGTRLNGTGTRLRETFRDVTVSSEASGEKRAGDESRGSHDSERPRQSSREQTGGLSDVVRDRSHSESSLGNLRNWNPPRTDPGTHARDDEQPDEHDADAPPETDSTR